MMRTATKIQSMRIALVSPYSWTYPGGVTRHIEALAERFLDEGHDVRVLAPYDPPDRFSAVLHRGARPQPVDAPDYLVSLGRTIGFKANGAVSNLSITPHGVATMHRELRTGGYDVVHIHEPVAPLTGLPAASSAVTVMVLPVPPAVIVVGAASSVDVLPDTAPALSAMLPEVAPARPVPAKVS